MSVIPILKGPKEQIADHDAYAQKAMDKYMAALPVLSDAQFALLQSGFALAHAEGCAYGVQQNISFFEHINAIAIRAARS